MLKIYTLEKKMTYLVPKNAVIYNKIKMTHWGNLLQWLLNGTLITCPTQKQYQAISRYPNTEIEFKISFFFNNKWAEMN